jgi:ADP-ribosyl-[dinitrogen reductase] hydrolase
LPDSRVKDRLIELEGVSNEVSFSEIGCRFGNSGYVVDSVPLALLAAQRIRILGFQQMILDLVSGGGDTDTIASIAGQVAGTLIGRAALPDEMLARIIERDLIEGISNEFADVAR